LTTIHLNTWLGIHLTRLSTEGLGPRHGEVRRAHQMFNAALGAHVTRCALTASCIKQSNSNLKSVTLCSASTFACQHDTARICCCGAVAVKRRSLSIDTVGRSAANPQHAAAVGQWDGQTDGRPTVT